MKTAEQSKFEDMLQQISMVANTYLSLALKISEKTDFVLNLDHSQGKLEILNNTFFQMLQTTAKAYTDEAMCNLSTLFSLDKDEISLSTYDGKFSCSLKQKLDQQRLRAIDLKVKDHHV